MTKTDLPYNTAAAGDPSDFEQASYIRDNPTGSDFCYNFVKNYPRDSRFSTICAKIYMLNLIIDKVTVPITFKSNRRQRNFRRWDRRTRRFKKK
jgi:hypothetical protein